WFTVTSASNDSIGRIDPLIGGDIAIQASVTQFALPNADSGPRGITAGPDGALWFTEFFADKIGRISTAGRITEIQVPPHSGPLEIIAASDGRLYFTEFSRNRIGRMTTTGALAELASDMSPHASPSGLAFGPDGALWFTEFLGGRIGRTPLMIGAVTAVAAG